MIKWFVRNARCSELSQCCHSVNRDVADSGSYVVVSNRTKITISTGKIFCVSHCLRESKIIKLEHVSNFKEPRQCLLLSLFFFLKAF